MAHKIQTTKFPSFIPQTDQARIESFPNVLTRYPDKFFYATEKIDGLSATYFLENECLVTCSRNARLISKGGFWWEFAEMSGLERALKNSTYRDVAIHGELVGPKIKGNHYNLDALEFYVFDVFDIKKQRYFDFIEIERLCKDVNLKIVPFVSASIYLGGDSAEMEDMVLASEGPSCLNPQIEREGIVVKPYKEDRDPDLGRLSFQITNPRFLRLCEE